ncbi:MAG: UbiA prenyltransferase family protein [Candidatus Thorarchaeota archaeon]
MGMLRGLISLTRPYVLLTTTSFYIAAAFLSTNAIPFFIPFLIGYAAVALAIASAHTLNDYFDWITDKENPRTANRAIPSGVVPSRLALILGLTYGAVAVVLTFFLNPLCVLLAFIAIPLPFAYNYMRKQEIPYSFVCTILAVFFIILLGSAAITGQYFPTFILLFVFFGMSWEMGRTLISEVQDVDIDKVSKVTTFSTIISSKRAAQLILILFLIASVMSVVIGVIGQLGFLYLIVAVMSSCWLIYRSVQLVKTPTTPNAVQMRYRAPRYLVTICLVLVLATLLNYIFF